ncbi:glutamate ABC transporter substrate-binding protein [Actinoplanes sp. NPDC051633]|uniref:glutamate ABC transporter substrate-binding protein n=1 Tax=Actinoplanes sp. NPDC051633 TaxID=3155670 RepID=UPI00343900C2
MTRVAAALCALVLTLALAACDGDDPAAGGTGNGFAAGSTMERLNKAQKIRVGTKFDQPGFGLKGADGVPAGFDVEIAKLVAKALGIPADKIDWVETPSNVREQAIREDKVDIVVATYTINEERKKLVSFAGPYYLAGQSLLVKADDNSITGPESLRNGTVRVCSADKSTAASNIEEFLTDKSDQLVLFNTYQKCVDALKEGQVDAVTTDNVILSGFVSVSDDAFKLAGPTFTTEPYGIGLSKDDKVFRDFINDSLETAFQDGSYRDAWKKTAGKFDTTELKIPAVERY